MILWQDFTGNHQIYILSINYIAEVITMIIEKAKINDAERILEIQKIAYIAQAKIYNDYTISPLVETLEELLGDFEKKTIYKATVDNSIVGSIRGMSEKGTCHIGRLAVLPEYQSKGIGTILIKKIEEAFCDCKRFELFTGNKSTDNIRLYEKLGYKMFKTEKYDDKASIVYLEKLLD
jgi:ribosomal protein S18 acetylase RimI-like enzyme